MVDFIINYIYIFSGCLLHLIAMNKGGSKSNRIFWAVIGFYFGPIAIPFIIFQRKNKGG